MGKRTILFVDEIHRFNKSQRDGLLPFVESGLVTFVGATTENPSFEVNSALLSRAQVYVLQALADEELRLLVKREQKRILPNLQLNDAAMNTLVGYADGDARRLLTFAEQTDLVGPVSLLACPGSAHATTGERCLGVDAVSQRNGGGEYP